MLLMEEDVWQLLTMTMLKMIAMVASLADVLLCLQ